MNNGEQAIDGTQKKAKPNLKLNVNLNLPDDEFGESVYLTQWQHNFNKTIWEWFYPIWKSSCFR
jgi:predicted carbohydrate-binding protein with CBM5 and CBM33 domain